jgi:hypothetical protein
MNYFATPKLKKSIFAILVVMLSSSCQKEEIIIIDKPNDEQKIYANSLLTNLIFRVTQNPTSVDNVLDRSNCVSINLPFNVFINGTLIPVGGSSGNNYQSVQTIINSYPTPPSVVMDFPIGVTGQDYSTTQIASQNQMNTVLGTCTSNGLNDISCAKIIYPVSVAMYNINTQTPSTFVIENNKQFFSFLANRLTNDVIANINYPISMIGSDNQNQKIYSNTELENFITTAALNCN